MALSAPDLENYSAAMPSPTALADLTGYRFSGHEKDCATLIALIVDLGTAPGMRIFDFGCSWGYGSWRSAQASYDVKSFEIYRPRARNLAWP